MVKEKFQKETSERYQNLSEEEKEIRQKMGRGRYENYSLRFYREVSKLRILRINCRILKNVLILYLIFWVVSSEKWRLSWDRFETKAKFKVQNF